MWTAVLVGAALLVGIFFGPRPINTVFLGLLVMGVALVEVFAVLIVILVARRLRRRRGGPGNHDGPAGVPVGVGPSGPVRSEGNTVDFPRE